MGVAALVALLVWVFRHTRPLRLGRHSGDVLRLALGFAFLDAFAYQGLGGSFEDSRHLWLLLGLFLAAGRLAPPGRPLRDKKRDGPSRDRPSLCSEASRA